ncbi:hypothetical protein [Krasilnikovia sp. MM14-A1004]|uniref:hypothetical protein n=1 Tax=Krasilnikovia sp. MM14-A1004 TaxID=3373541 RepID=UPI00399CA013
MSKISILRGGILAAVLATLVAVIATPQAAQASGQSPYVRKGSYCIFVPSGSEGTALVMGGCGLVGTMKRQDTSRTYNGHPLIFVRYGEESGPPYPYCLDNLGQASGQVRDYRCNGGSYQQLEVFDVGSGKKVLKSLGAYLGNGRHLCLSAGTTKNAALVWATCNTAASTQQFNWNP